MDRHLINNLFPKLVIYKPGTEEWEWELSAAEHFEQVDPLTFSFRLKPGLMWTNGYGEVTAEDVKYSFERHLDPEVGSWNDKEFEWMEEVEVTGKYSGLIKMKRPSPEFIRSPLARVPGAIVSKKAVEEAGGTFATDPPATAGPYRIEEFVSGEKMILVRDDAWPGKHGDFDRIVMIPITDENARITAMRAGEIDWASVSPGVVPALEANMPEGTTLDVRDTLAVFWLGMSQKNRRSRTRRYARRFRPQWMSTPSLKPCTRAMPGAPPLSPRRGCSDTSTWRRRLGTSRRRASCWRRAGSNSRPFSSTSSTPLKC